MTSNTTAAKGLTAKDLAKLNLLASDPHSVKACRYYNPTKADQKLIDDGYIVVEYKNGRDFSPTGAALTDAGWRAIGKHLVPCDGDAHANPYIDNCLMCAPRWGEVVVPAEYASLGAYRTRSMGPK